MAWTNRGGLGSMRRLMDADVTASRLLDWYRRNARDLPWRRTTDPYAIWISEVMLQQTQVKTVIPYWERWLARLPTVSALANAAESEVLKLWEGLGYYRRARNLQAAARRIHENCGGVFPREFAAILDLPGIGRYTAGAIASIAFNASTPILDGNVIRVLTRLRALRGDPSARALNSRLWNTAQELVDAAAATGRPSACSHLNQSLMELGATVCLPRQPECEACPLADRCKARRAGNQESLPSRRRGTAATARHFVVILARHRGRYCVRQRSAHAINGGLWEFPNEEVPGPEPDAAAVAEGLFGVLLKLQPVAWGRVRHTITRYRITQHVFRLELAVVSAAVRRVGEWKTPAELETLAFGSAHRRIVRRLRDESRT